MNFTFHWIIAYDSLLFARYGLFAGVPLVARSEEKRLDSQIYWIKINVN